MNPGDRRAESRERDGSATGQQANFGKFENFPAEKIFRPKRKMHDDRICSEDACSVQPADAREYMAMDDDVVLDMRRCEELWLIRSFLSLTVPGRQRVLKLAEQLAEDAADDPAGLSVASIEASPAETPKDFPGRTD